MMRRSWRAPAAAIWAYSGVALAAAVAAVVALRLWQADLRVPFSYRGDALFFAMMVKAVVDHGWYLTNPQLGAPGVLALHDFPQADAVHLAAVKVMSLLSHDWALLFNLYFLLGFPLIALSAFAVFRQFRIASGPALAAALLYAFQPSRLIMGESHFFLTAFWQVPLAILVVLWVAGDEPPLFAPGARAWRPRLALRNRRSIAAVAIALLVSGTGVYYAFFTGVLIVVAGAWSAIERRSPRHALAGVALTALIVLGLGVQSIPTLRYRRAMGPNPAVAARPVGEAETFGLKIAPLLLPVGGHRVPALAAITDRYERATAARSELSSTSLGLMGAIGFLVLLGMLFRRANPAADPVVLPGGPPPLLPGLARLARLNLAALLLATTGGFGALFALLASPLIRAYARMHVFIAFFALFAIAALLDRIWRTRPRAGLLLTAAVAFVGVADQVPARAAPSYARQRRDYRADAAFVHALEAQLRPGAQIFQLPYLRFPESGGLPGTRLGDYDPLRPYLHARALRWSYPTMFGRSGDAWISGVADEPVPELVRTLSDAGFDGILVDCRGYPDDGAEVVAALSVALGPDPTTRATDRYVFFDLAAAKERALAGLDQDERDRRREEALDRPVLRWLDGFFAPEHDRDGFFRWCGGDCTLEIANPGARDARVALSMRIAAAQPPVSLQVTGDVWSEAIELGPRGAPVSRTLHVPVGRHRVRFRCDGAPAVAPHDPRHLVFRIDDPHLRVAGD